MRKRALFAAVLVMVAGTADATVPNQALTGPQPLLKNAGTMNFERPDPGYLGQHFENSLGCVYSRTQAPGYPLVWHILVNTRVTGCPNTVPGY